MHFVNSLGSMSYTSPNIIPFHTIVVFSSNASPEFSISMQDASSMSFDNPATWTQRVHVIQILILSEILHALGP